MLTIIIMIVIVIVIIIVIVRTIIIIIAIVIIIIILIVLRTGLIEVPDNRPVPYFLHRTIDNSACADNNRRTNLTRHETRP